MVQHTNNELAFATKINHPSILSPIDAYSSKNQIHIVYKYAANGELFNYLKQFGHLPTRIAKNYAHQLIDAVAEIHKAQVCHRDLKLENIVLNADFKIQIIDFGIACPLQGTLNSGFCGGDEKVGTLSYMTPEMHMGFKYQPVVADIFALGVIIFALFAGNMPFDTASINDPLYRNFA